MTGLPTQYPLAPPTVSGATVTLDMLLNQPTRITRFLSDLSLQNMFVNRIYSNTGSVSGGALVYDQLTANDLYTDRDVQNVEPGAEYPIVTSSRPTPQVAQVEKFGGKFPVTDEAKDRNDESVFRNGANKLMNTIVRKINTRGIAVLDAAVTAASRTATGVNWSTALSTAASSLTKNMGPAVDFAKVQLVADTDELGVVFNLWIVNPQEYSNLIRFYGAGDLPGVLSASNVEVIATNRVAAGTAYAVEAGQVGEMRFEAPLASKTYYEDKIDTTWVQASVRPVFAVTNPMSVVKISGLAG